MVSELRRSPYKPKISILASRERLCVNQSVFDAKDGGSLRQRCRHAVKHKTCEHHVRLSDPDLAVSLHEQLMPEGSECGGAFDMEDLIAFGKNNTGYVLLVAR